MIRQIATVALLGWYACLAIVGPGLHEVLGCEHHHQHGLAFAGRSIPIGTLIANARHDAHDDDGCPLCNLLSMAQTAPVIVRPDCVANVLPIRVWFSCGSIAAAPRPLCQIRGPPAAVATV